MYVVNDINQLQSKLLLRDATASSTLLFQKICDLRPSNAVTELDELMEINIKYCKVVLLF